jgi:DNA-binding response OmpR family regulator
VRNRIYERALRAMPGPGIRVNVESGICWIKGQVVDPPLAGDKWSLLTILWENAGRVCEYKGISKHVWGDPYQKDLLPALVARLRRIIKEYDADNEYIVNVPSKGYVLRYAQDKEPRQ